MKITEIQEKYGLPKTDFWELKRGGKSSWILTHDACEKIAYKEGIIFKSPQVFRDNNSNVAMLGEGVLGDRTEWTTGEANPSNCKMAYNWAMAEKRLKDRLTLKLINAYEYGIYSEVEADDFSKPKSKPVTEKQKNLIMRLEALLDGKLKHYADFNGMTSADASDYIDKLKLKITEYEKELHER